MITESRKKLYWKGPTGVPCKSITAWFTPVVLPGGTGAGGSATARDLSAAHTHPHHGPGCGQPQPCHRAKDRNEVVALGKHSWPWADLLC